MADIEKYLIASESSIVVTRRHWASLTKIGSICVPIMLLGLLLLGKGGGSQPVAIFAVLILLGASAVLAWNWIEWYHGEVVVTDRRVLLIYGILTRRVGIMPLSKVTDLTYERTLFGRILGYGAFVIESAGQHQAFSRIEYLPAPDKLYHEVSLLLFPERTAYQFRQPDRPTTPLPRDR